MEWNFKLRQTCTFHVSLNVWELWCRGTVVYGGRLWCMGGEVYGNCSVWGETVVYGGRLWCMGNT